LGAIKTRGGQPFERGAPWGLSVHAWIVLGSLLTHLCLQECESIVSE